MIKKKNIPVAELRKFFKEIKQYLPEWVLSPVSFITTSINFFNDIIMILCYLILIGQSARLISKEQRYIDLKVLLYKWILIISFQTIFGQIQENNFEGVCLKFLFLSLIFMIIYPSKVSKSIFRNYFDQQMKLENQKQMSESTIFANNSLFQKIIQKSIISLLKIAKLMIKLVHPVNRKSIEDQIKATNLIIQKQRYDWGTDQAQMKRETNKKSQNPQDIIKNLQVIKEQPVNDKDKKGQKTDQKSHIESKTSLFSNLQQNPKVKDIKDSTYEMKDSIEAMKQSSSVMKQSISMKVMKDSNATNKNPMKQQKSIKKYRKYSVSEYLSLFNTTNRSRFMPTSPSTKRCTYYREIQISYDVDSAVMTVTSLEDMKVSYHNLQEIILLDDLMVQFEFQDNQNMIVKFKSKIEFDEFITAIDVYESGLQK